MTEAGRLRPTEHAAWRDDKMGKSTLFRSERLLLGLNAFEPGQQHAAHAHEGTDKAYVVLEGHGTFTVGADAMRAEAGDVVVAPSGVPHGVVNDSGERLLVLVTLAPPPG